MDRGDLLDKLHSLNESELFYREYYALRNDPKKLAAFMAKVDPAFLEKNYLVIPDSSDYESSHFREDMFFIEDRAQDVMVLKHNCYSPPTRHKHTFFEMLYVAEGSCEHSVGDSRFHMGAGEICIVSPGVLHSVSVFDESVIINFLIRSSTFEDMFSNLLKGNHVLSAFFMNNIYSKKINEYLRIDTERDQELFELALEIMLEYENKSAYYFEVMNSQLVTFFAKVLRSYEGNCHLPPFAKTGDAQSFEIIRYIRENYKAVTITDIAQHFKYSEDYVSKLIKNVTGYTFTQLHKNIRLHKASRLLEETNLSIQDISDALGYLNPEHFIRIFKKEYHSTPNEYRKLHSLRFL